MTTMEEKEWASWDELTLREQNERLRMKVNHLEELLAEGRHDPRYCEYCRFLEASEDS